MHLSMHNDMSHRIIRSGFAAHKHIRVRAAELYYRLARNARMKL